MSIVYSLVLGGGAGYAWYLTKRSLKPLAVTGIVSLTLLLTSIISLFITNVAVWTTMAVVTAAVRSFLALSLPLGPPRLGISILVPRG